VLTDPDLAQPDILKLKEYGYPIIPIVLNENKGLS
jgi:hypothetical protein